MDGSEDIVLITADCITQTVRDGKDTGVFHFKVHTQAWCFSQITLCKPSYIIFGDPCTHSFISGRLRQMGENCHISASNQSVFTHHLQPLSHSWALTPSPKSLSPLTFCFLPWPLSVETRQVTWTLPALNPYLCGSLWLKWVKEQLYE